MLRHHDIRGGAPAWSEIKRLWVDPSVRGLGLGRRLLVSLEQRAAEAGSPIVRLDTNRVLTQAIAMYRAEGYREVPPFNENPYAHHWFEKDPHRPRAGAGSPSGGFGRCEHLLDERRLGHRARPGVATVDDDRGHGVDAVAIGLDRELRGLDAPCGDVRDARAVGTPAARPAGSAVRSA